MMKKIKILKTIALALTMASFIAISPSKASADVQAYWKSNNNNWYYIDSTGKTQTGWLQDNGHWYYLGSDGVMKTGWIYDSGNWYYCWSNGQMATDTTIGGYYLNSSGAWTTSTSTNSNSGTALTSQDVSGTHHVRVDISSSDGDFEAQNKLTNYNLSLSDKNKSRMRSLAIDLAQGRMTIDEARSNCIGKVVDGYKITDIKFFDQSFSVTTGTNPEQKIKAIQNSSLAEYKSSSSYKYDDFQVFSCGNARSAEWEAMRVVVEFEAV